MNFYNHTSAWIKGELFEATLILSFGAVAMLAGYLFWKIGTTPSSKALLLPFVITGIIYAVIGGGMLVSNNKRTKEFEQTFQQGNKAFIQSEKARVEGFQYGYVISKIVATVFFTATLLIFWTTKNPTWQGIGIGLTLFALAGLVVDYFSQERADIYYKTILDALK
ncbi:MAG: hypothetical protein QM786_10030 [Breznakibacter sp.]